MIPYYPTRPDLGQHEWHEENGFYHGYINGVYYRMVATLEELEEIREKESKRKGRPVDNDEVWHALDVQNYVDPWDEWYGPFESASPFEDDLDFEPRRRIIALNMYLDPDTTTWIGLGKRYSLLMRHRRQEERRKALKQCILALGLDPNMEQHPETRRRRALAFEYGLNPYTATWQDIDATGLELHKVALSEELARRAKTYLFSQPMNFEDLLQKALASYLDQIMPTQEEDGKEQERDEEPTPRCAPLSEKGEAALR